MPIQLSRFEFVENAGPNSVKAALKDAFAAAQSIDIQVAFASEAGVAALLPPMRKVAAKRGGKVRILVGLYQRITTPSALRMLLEAQDQTRGQLEVRLACETHFHRKMYISRTRKTVTVLIGSSNLTMDGLQSSGEMNVMASLANSSRSARHLMEIFESDWKDDQSVPLTSSKIRVYERQGRPTAARMVSKGDLKQILGAGAKHSKANSSLDESDSCRYWRDEIAGYVKDRTEVVIADETSWDKRGWDWASATPQYRRGDRILFIDTADRPGWTYLAEIRQVTRTGRRTPDGRYFAAFTKLSRTRKRKLTRRMRKELRKSGFSPDANPGKLTAKLWAHLQPLFAQR
jgi:HKD family nuclease